MIICAAIKDTRTGAVFGGIRHGDIYHAYGLLQRLLLYYFHYSSMDATLGKNLPFLSFVWY